MTNTAEEVIELARTTDWPDFCLKEAVGNMFQEERDELRRVAMDVLKAINEVENERTS